jgi:hypothetical protein
MCVALGPIVGERRGCRRAARLALPGSGVYGGSRGEIPSRTRSHGAVRSDVEREDAMSWTKPAFEEIKMDAEAKSYSDGITW